MADRKPAVAGTLSIRGVEYVVIPRAEFLRTRDSALPSGTVDAHAFVRESIAESLRAARARRSEASRTPGCAGSARAARRTRSVEKTATSAQRRPGSRDHVFAQNG